MYEYNIDTLIKGLANVFGDTICNCNDGCRCNCKVDDDTVSRDEVCKCENEKGCCKPKNSEYYKYSEYVNGKKVFEKEKGKHNGKTIFECEHDYLKKTGSGLGCRQEPSLSSDTTCFENPQKDDNIQVTSEQMKEFVDKVEYIESKFVYYEETIKLFESENKRLREENKRLNEDNSRKNTFISKLRRLLAEYAE